MYSQSETGYYKVQENQYNDMWTGVLILIVLGLWITNKTKRKG